MSEDVTKENKQNNNRLLAVKWHASSRLQLNWLKDYDFIIWISDTVILVRGLVSYYHNIYDKNITRVMPTTGFWINVFSSDAKTL